MLKLYLPLGTLEGVCFALILGDVISEAISFTYMISIYLLDIKHHFTDFKINNNNCFLFRIFKIFTPVALTSYLRSGLSSIKQIIIPSRLEKSGLNCSIALSTIRYYIWYGNACNNVSSFSISKFFGIINS